MVVGSLAKLLLICRCLEKSFNFNKHEWNKNKIKSHKINSYSDVTKKVFKNDEMI